MRSASGGAMEQRRPTKKEIVDWIVAGATLGFFKSDNPTKKEIVDWIVAEATLGRFRGDKRDGEAPPITIQNFTNEMVVRYAAKALRARLSRLSYAELLTEAVAAADYVKAQREQISQSGERAERLEREATARVLSQRQAELGRRSRLQPAILAAAHHYRQIAKKGAKEAWLAIKHKPYEAADGSVAIEP